MEATLSKEEQIMETLEDLLSKMTEAEKDRFLSFGEGMSFMKEKQIAEAAAADQ